ncbi:MAG: hypothetical protein IPL40_11465 [Proteobacteria bacterium]|nr:hypothetical protein [Pseudomonadota bacterium]
MSKGKSTAGCPTQVLQGAMASERSMPSLPRTWLAALALLALLALALASAGCSGRECTSGTIAVGDECRPAEAQVTCGPGFKVVGIECRPDDDWVKNYCDAATTTFQDGKCVGTGGPAGLCANKCPAAAGSTICVAGRVLEFTSLLAKGAKEATPLSPASGVEVALYDPVQFLTQPGSPPIATAAIDDENGCFTIPQINLPLVAPVFAAGVRAKAGGAATTLIQAAVAIFGRADTNVTTAEVLAVNQATTDAWGVSDLLTAGSMALWYRSESSGAGIEGVVPTQSGNLPASWTGPTW